MVNLEVLGMSITYGKLTRQNVTKTITCELYTPGETPSDKIKQRIWDLYSWLSYKFSSTIDILKVDKDNVIISAQIETIQDLHLYKGLFMSELKLKSFRSLDSNKIKLIYP